MEERMRREEDDRALKRRVDEEEVFKLFENIQLVLI
jgi:hypothetical protein